MENPESLRLLREYWYLPGVIVRQDYPALPDSEKEDLEAIGLYGLLRAARTWARSGGAGFVTYAGICIRRKIQNALKVEGRRWRRETGGMIPVSLEEPTTENGATWENVVPDQSADTEGEVLLRDLWQRIHALPERERTAVYLYYCEGETYREVGAAVGLNHGMAYKVVTKALQTIRRQFEG
jgi:RNA polymerase sigma factor (sigma-70 family)